MRRTTTRFGTRSAAGSGTRSGRERSALDAAYDECRRLVRTTRPTEYALMQLMPPTVRPACWALYAALASADDLLDSTEGTPQERSRRLQEWRSALEADLAGGTSDDPVRLALTDAVWHWGLDPGDLLGALDDGLEARGAEPVDGDGGGLDPASGPEGDVPRQVRGVGGGLQHVADDGVIHLVGRGAGPGERRLRGDHREVGGGVLLQLAAEGTEAAP